MWKILVIYSMGKCTRISCFSWGSPADISGRTSVYTFLKKRKVISIQTSDLNIVREVKIKQL